MKRLHPPFVLLNQSLCQNVEFNSELKFLVKSTECNLIKSPMNMIYEFAGFQCCTGDRMRAPH